METPMLALRIPKVQVFYETGPWIKGHNNAALKALYLVSLMANRQESSDSYYYLSPH